jgi:integral membrane protein
MALKPKLSNLPRIRSALRLYRVTSIVTGTFLLLLVLMMVFRYGFGVDIEMNGPYGFLALTPKEQIEGINLSTIILIVHGWFYVVYLFSDFRLWSLMRWPFGRFILIALGGVIPFLSFILEVRIAREVRAYLDRRESETARDSTGPDAASSTADTVEAQQ